MAGGKWRIRIVFETELDRLSDLSAGNLGGDVETKVDSRCDATGGDHVPVFDHAAFLVRGANERQQLGIGPVRRGPAIPE